VVKSRNALMDAAMTTRFMSTTDDRQPHQASTQEFKVVDDDFEMIETLYGVGYRFKE
jgi:two-component system response regulator ChvI